MAFSPIDAAKVMAPMIGCYAALIALFWFLGDGEESLATLNLRQALGAVVLGGLTIALVGRTHGLALFERKQVKMISIIGAAAFGIMCVMFPYYLIVSGIPYPRFAPFGPYQPFGLGEPALWLVLVLMVIYVLAEELYFRGVVHRALRKHVSIPIAVAASSMVFAAVHIVTNPMYIAILVAAGVFAAVTYEYTGTLLLGTVQHLSANFGVVLLSSTTLAQHRPVLFPLLSVISALVCACVLAYHLIHRRRLENHGTDLAI